MVKLNAEEIKIYHMIIMDIIPELSPGKYMARDFFGDIPCVPRIARRLCEDTKAGNLSRLSLVGKKSSDGYRVI